MLILRLSIALFLAQAGFHAWTATLPLSMARAGAPDASVGLVMGVAGIVQVPGAIVGGRLLDRFGGLRLFGVAGLAYLAAGLLVLVTGANPATNLAPIVGARVLQGIGIGLSLPSALSLVPGLVAPMRQAAALSYVGAAHNMAMMVLPALSLAILDMNGLAGVAWLVVAASLGSVLLARRMPIRPQAATRDATMAIASRRFGITYRREWAMPLLIIVLYVAHWGVVTSYLPIRADAAGASSGLFFATDGLGIVLMRLATGRLAERFSLRALVITGALSTGLSLVILLFTPSNASLVACGLLGGVGGAIVMTPITIELSRRSTDADRGSGFALFSAALATAMTLGAVGGAPIVATFNFETGILVGLALLLAGTALAALNRPLAEPIHQAPAAAT